MLYFSIRTTLSSVATYKAKHEKQTQPQSTYKIGLVLEDSVKALRFQSSVTYKIGLMLEGSVKSSTFSNPSSTDLIDSTRVQSSSQARHGNSADGQKKKFPERLEKFQHLHPLRS